MNLSQTLEGSDRDHLAVRCPFVMGILSKQPVLGQGGPPPEAMPTIPSPTVIAGKHS
jgi:hypothetical protein